MVDADCAQFILDTILYLNEKHPVSAELELLFDDFNLRCFDEKRHRFSIVHYLFSTIDQQRCQRLLPWSLYEDRYNNFAQGAVEFIKEFNRGQPNILLPFISFADFTSPTSPKLVQLLQDVAITSLECELSSENIPHFTKQCSKIDFDNEIAILSQKEEYYRLYAQIAKTTDQSTSIEQTKEKIQKLTDVQEDLYKATSHLVSLIGITSASLDDVPALSGAVLDWAASNEIARKKITDNIAKSNAAANELTALCSRTEDNSQAENTRIVNHLQIGNDIMSLSSDDGRVSLVAFFAALLQKMATVRKSAVSSMKNFSLEIEKIVELDRVLLERLESFANYIFTRGETHLSHLTSRYEAMPPIPQSYPGEPLFAFEMKIPEIKKVELAITPVDKVSIEKRVLEKLGLQWNDSTGDVSVQKLSKSTSSTNGYFVTSSRPSDQPIVNGHSNGELFNRYQKLKQKIFGSNHGGK